MTGEEPTGQAGRWWIAAAVTQVVVLSAARGLSRTEQFRDGPLGHWYGYVGLAVAIAAGFAAVRWLVSRAYRSPDSRPDDPPK